MYTSFGVSSNNSVEHVKFVNAKPVYFPPMERKWGSDNGGSTAYKTAVIRDKDGSFGDGPNSYVLINDGVNDSIAADAEACEIKPTWNAAVCKGDVGRLNIGGPGGGVVRRRRSWSRCGLVRCRSRWLQRWRWSRRPGGPGAAGGPGGPGGPGGGFGGGGARCSCSAASRSQPQWQGLQPDRHQRTRRYRDQGDHRKAVLALRLTELDRGSWVIFELPGFTTAASGTPQDSLDALRKASDTSYYKDKDALWVKVVSNGDAPARRPWWWNQPPGQPAEPCCMSKSPRRSPGSICDSPGLGGFLFRHPRQLRWVEWILSFGTSRRYWSSGSPSRVRTE